MATYFCERSMNISNIIFALVFCSIGLFVYRIKIIAFTLSALCSNLEECPLREIFTERGLFFCLHKYAYISFGMSTIHTIWSRYESWHTAEFKHQWKKNLLRIDNRWTQKNLHKVLINSRIFHPPAMLFVRIFVFGVSRLKKIENICCWYRMAMT